MDIDILKIVLTAGMTVGLIGCVVGAILYICSKIFFVKVDERIEIIHEMLPHFNCGACGTAGCMAFAETLISKENDISKCRPCKPDRKEQIIKKLEEIL